MSEKLRCIPCGGRGWIEVYVEQGCPFIQEPCPDCGGKGFVPVEEETAARDFTFPPCDPHEEGTLEAGLDAALELHNREETLLARAEKAECACAEKDTALHNLLSTLDNEHCSLCVDTYPDGSCAGDDECVVMVARKAAEAALSSSAGKAMLARLQHLEQAEGLVQRLDALQKVRLTRSLDRVPGDDEAADWGGDWEELLATIDAYLNPKLPAPDEDDEPKEEESHG
jgi:predicted  nucleic acid-binding Zn-ribbon protein